MLGGGRSAEWIGWYDSEFEQSRDVMEDFVDGGVQVQQAH